MTENAPGAPGHRGYWQAQGLIERQLSRFQAALEQQNSDAQRSAFYHLAGYHGGLCISLTPPSTALTKPWPKVLCIT